MNLKEKKVYYATLFCESMEEAMKLRVAGLTLGYTNEVLKNLLEKGIISFEK